MEQTSGAVMLAYPRERAAPPRLPPLENGDRLTRGEFERRYNAMPHVKKAELIEGIVYMPSPVSYTQHSRKRAAPRRLPPLENGDHLTRAEFERRYNAMQNVKNAELIEGIVYMPSPVSYTQHSGPHLNLAGWLAVYRASTPGVDGGDNGTVRLDEDNELQPDAFLFISTGCGGQARVDDDDFVGGAPELVVEVAASRVSRDLHVKMNVYRRNGVKEYIVWRVRDQAFDWFVLRDGKYERLQPVKGAAGHKLYKSEAFPGLWLDPEAMLKNNLAAVLEVLRGGLASSEHAVFVTRLKEAAAKKR